MIIYKVDLCLKLVISRLKRFNLGEYNSERPTVFIEATNPDDACSKAVYNMMQIILRQDNSKETISLCRSVFKDIRVLKVITPQ